MKQITIKSRGFDIQMD